MKFNKAVNLFIVPFLFGIPLFGQETLRIQQLTLHSDEPVVTANVLDPLHGMAYFATSESDFKYSLEQSSAKLVRIQLQNLRRIEELKLKPGDGPLRAGLINRDGSHAYFGVYGDPNRGRPARVLGISLLRWKRGPDISLGEGDFGISSAVMDPDERIAYFGTMFGSVVGVRVPEMQIVGSLALQKEDNGFECAVLDPQGEFGYFGTTSGNIMKIRLNGIGPAGNITASRGGDGFGTADMAPDGQNAYFGTKGSPSRVTRVEIRAFKASGTLSLEEGENKLLAGIISPDQSYLYVVTGEIPIKVIEVRLLDFQRVRSFVLPAHFGHATSVLPQLFRSHLILAAGERPARILKILLPQ